MAKTASLKKTSRAGSRSVPNPLPDPAGSSAAAVLLAVAGGVVTWRDWSSGTVFDEDTSRAFGLVVGIEFAVAGLGALVLALRRRSDLASAWVALVVGIHLFPVAALLGYSFIHVVAALVTLVAVAAVPVARSRGVAVSAVTGLATGSVLLAAGLVSLVTAVARM